MEVLRFSPVRVTLLMWVETPGVSFTAWLCPALCLQGCKEMAKWDLRASCCADLDKNNPGQSCTPFSNSLSVNSALERSRTEEHLGLCKNFLASFMTGTTKFFCVLTCAVAFQVITQILLLLCLSSLCLRCFGLVCCVSHFYPVFRVFDSIFPSLFVGLLST